MPVATRNGRCNPTTDEAQDAEPPKQRRLGMQRSSNGTQIATGRMPWNKGKVVGAKSPLQTKHVWSIRTKLQLDGRARDLAMFNLAIDSKLRGCDVVRI